MKLFKFRAKSAAPQRPHPHQTLGEEDHASIYTSKFPSCRFIEVSLPLTR